MNLSNNNSQLIVQCPECHTKFAVSDDAFLDIDEPQFHCSRCDNIFSIPKKDLKPAQKAEDNKIETPFSLRSKEDNFFDENPIKQEIRETKRTSAFLKKADHSLFNHKKDEKTDIDAIRTNTINKESPYHSFTIPQAKNAIYNSDAQEETIQEELNFESNEKESPKKNSEIDSWLDSKATEFENSLSSYKNDSSKDKLDTQEDLLAPPKRHQWEDSSFEPISSTPDDFQENIISKKQIRSWNAVFRLTALLFTFLIFLIFLGSYSLTHNDIFKKFDIGLFSYGNLAPEGLFLKNIKTITTSLNNGENINLLTGKIINDSTEAINNIIVESFLFDKDGNTIAIQRTNADSQLSTYKVRDLAILRTDIINAFQSTKMSKKHRLAPGEQMKIAIAFTNPNDIKKATSFGLRIYTTF